MLWRSGKSMGGFGNPYHLLLKTAAALRSPSREVVPKNYRFLAAITFALIANFRALSLDFILDYK